MNISRSVDAKKKLVVKKLQGGGGAKMAISGAKLTFGGENKFWEYKSSRGRKKPITIRKANKKVATFFLFFVCFVDSKNFVVCTGGVQVLF